ncbi:Nucleolar Complex 2 protein [Malassezia vespertilionis]|uniref:Noc2p n=1 Tax=Malassezia vespertilionis TaxID=2020962 RepID=A0A2N1J9H2_9BASI|nr:Nucleolar Complex 2 protein [Malassezia vespertilionis]PKI83203.1 Noc2p [Malassezia vespertilionis]WFD07871.1 Nucleolar Complex 2 protein [Malassezia vespertilionis]
MAKAAKRTKKFIKNKLDTTLEQRRTQKKKAVHFKENKARKERRGHRDAEEEDGDEEEEEDKDGGMSVDAFLQGGFHEEMDEEDEDEDEDEGADDMLDAMEDVSDEEDHAQDLEKLAENDPEFYRYLQENDKNLLNFGSDDEEMGEEDAPAGDDDDDDDENEQQIPVVTAAMLQTWQRAILKHHSLRALRRILLAYRAAVFMGDEHVHLAYRVLDGDVFSSVVMAALKYTPMALQHHIPTKRAAEGRFKVPTHTKKWSLLVRPVRSYFLSTVQLLRTLSDPTMVYAALTESAKMVPYLHHDRRVMRDYVKVLLQLWSTATDRVRLAAFSCLYLVTASAFDEEMIDFCLKSTYHAFVRSSKLTTPHTMPNIVLMKNTACELFALHPEASYQQAFGFIRQLAISLRNCLKIKTKEQYQAVLNWPYIHCLDFWSLALAHTCAEAESNMRPLIYPLVQVALGVARLVPISRYFPLRLHVVQTMQRLVQCTGVYIPLAPLMLEVFDSPEFQRKPKGATLKPLDLETTLRAPQAYVRTKVYADQLADAYAFALLEFLASQALNIAFPEMVIPVAVQLRRLLKSGTSARLHECVKPVLDKVQQNTTWIEQKRSTVEFAPQDHGAVDNFLRDTTQEAPLASALRLARKVREQKRKLLEQTTHVVGDDEE